MSDESSLITKARAGDRSAFGQLVSLYQDRLYNTLLHVVGSSETAHDVAQDAFCQAYRKLESFAGQSAFYTWLYRIALNLALSQRRKKREALASDVDGQGLPLEPIGRELTPMAQLEQAERVEQVRQALAALDAQHRAVLVLREIDGHDYDAIADILGVPIGTVRSRLSRAREQMRRQLRGVLQEDTN